MSNADIRLFDPFGLGFASWNARGSGTPVAILYAAVLGTTVLLANVVLRPLAYRLHPIQQTGREQEVTYAFKLICRVEDEAHIRALLLQALARTR
jgi:putative Mg2+ transporter-C (MgtC) family protein